MDGDKVININRYEEERLATLLEYRVLDSLPEESFDNLARITAEICNAPIALITLVDRERQWFKSKVGLTAEETPRDISFCAHAVKSGDILVVEDALQDQRFSKNPLVLSSPDIRFYAGVPIFAYNGHRLGTLCVIDTKPRKLKKNEKKTLEIFAQEVEKHLELRRLKFQNEELTHMILHDINSPLTVVTGTTELLIKSGELNDFASDSLSRIFLESQKIIRMTDDLLDILKNGEHLVVNKPIPTDLVLFFQIFNETVNFKMDVRKRHFDSVMDIGKNKVGIDNALLHRILDNLIDNAIKYSPNNSVITMQVNADKSNIIIRVSDQGEGIPINERENIFEKYYRLKRDNDHNGLGIGLAFCKMAANCMGGTISLEEYEMGRGSTFKLMIPFSSS